MRWPRWSGWRSSRPPFALDLGSEYAQVLALGGGPGEWHLAARQGLPLPPVSLLEGDASDRQHLADDLRDHLTLLGLEGRPVRMALPGEAVIMRVLELPSDLDGTDLLQDVRERQAELYLPYTRQEADIDLQVLEHDPGSPRKGLMVATRRRYTDHLRDFCDRLGVELLSLEPRVLAALRALRADLELLEPGEGCLLLHVGIGSSELTLVRNGVPLFNRSLVQGVRALLRSQYPDLEELPWNAILRQDLMLDSAAGMRQVLQMMAQEVQRSVEFVLSQLPDLRVERLFLGGPGAAMTGIEPYLDGVLPYPVVLGDPVRANGVRIEDASGVVKMMPASLLVAVGLALKGVDDAAD